jgi:cyclopropane fatty-acyl-phospholipid synthase-like methyltransferase
MTEAAENVGDTGRVQRLTIRTLLLMLALMLPVPAVGQTVIESKTPLRDRDVIFVPTREAVATAMMKLAGVTKNDVVYDLGCGDGALLIAAARLGARVVGVDIDPVRIKEATANVRAAGVQDRVTLIRGDIFEPSSTSGDATVVTLYLLQALNEKRMPRLKAELRPGTRVVSHAFTMGASWPAEQSVTADGTTVHLWTIK